MINKYWLMRNKANLKIKMLCWFKDKCKLIDKDKIKGGIIKLYLVWKENWM